MITIKASLATKVIFVLSILLFLFAPFKLIQFIALTVFFFILLSYLYVSFVSSHLVVERTIDTIKLANHEQFDIKFAVKNYSRLPVFGCYIYDSPSTLFVFDKATDFMCRLRPREIVNLSYRIQAQNRGEYIVGPISLSVSDPLYLFTAKNEFESNLKIIVRPANISLGVEFFPGLPQGTLKTNNLCFEDVTMRKCIREYKPGDELKRINWRASAKYNDFFTNEYQYTYDVPVFVFVNLAEEDYELHNRLYMAERALEIAAAIVKRAGQLRLSCGFAAYGTDFPYLKPAQNQTDFILDILSTIRMEEGKLDYEPVSKFKQQLPFGTLLFVIGPKEVTSYELKTQAQKTDIDTTSLNIVRRLWK